MLLAGGLRQCRSQYDFWYFSGCGKHQRQSFWAFLSQSPALWFLVSYSPLAQKRTVGRSDGAQGWTARAVAAAAALAVAAL